ncbi:MAG: hypothetical protein IIX80_04195 [Clostridia bacterium]|nr:hypothetical protein [Clostridia bacterium]
MIKIKHGVAEAVAFGDAIFACLPRDNVYFLPLSNRKVKKGGDGMEVDQRMLRAVVREGYQVLLRAEAELLLPVGKKAMREFYLNLGKACMNWVKEVEGERMRRAFLELLSPRERSAFRAGHYRFRMRIPWESEGLAAMVCESELKGENDLLRGGMHRTAQVWDLKEELILPPSQVLALLAPHIGRRMLPFTADGIYPEGEFLVAFRNPSSKGAFLEKRIPRALLGQKKRGENPVSGTVNKL